MEPTCEAVPKLAADWYKALRKVYGIPGKMFGGDLFHEGEMCIRDRSGDASGAVKPGPDQFGTQLLRLKHIFGSFPGIHYCLLYTSMSRTRSSRAP